MTIVLTTHDMDEAAKLCDRVGIVDHGKLLALDSPEKLTSSLPGSTTVSVTVSPDGTDRTDSRAVTAALTGLDGVVRVEADAAVGMVIGTSVSPRRINIMFAVILTPLLFTGSAQFPWSALEHLRWFQVVCALNPLTYVSEGMRAVLAPEVPHLRWASARRRSPRPSWASARWG